MKDLDSLRPWLVLCACLVFYDSTYNWSGPSFYSERYLSLMHHLMLTLYSTKSIDPACYRLTSLHRHPGQTPIPSEHLV
jgi:hypothetical protein